jgi:hypothetical protein
MFLFNFFILVTKGRSQSLLGNHYDVLVYSLSRSDLFPKDSKILLKSRQLQANMIQICVPKRSQIAQGLSIRSKVPMGTKVHFDLRTEQIA